jgi:hypothetical protein
MANSFLGIKIDLQLRLNIKNVLTFGRNDAYYTRNFIEIFCKNKILLNCVPNGTNRCHKQVLLISSVVQKRYSLDPSIG